MGQNPLKLGDRFKIVDAPFPWSSFTYEITKVHELGYKLEIVKDKQYEQEIQSYK